MSGLSIIIVNYNVKYFLRQCLQSIYKTNFTQELEVIVVDNDSKDGSIEMIKNDFSEVQLIANQENVGFSKANNQGIALATQAYTLILNPDTILQEDTLERCYALMEEDSSIGAVGVRMVDGSGNYLPESKRGFPTPLSALFKMSGLAKIFPSSKILNHYYLGHLNPDVVNEVDVLTGAFMFCKTALLKEIGGFDEDYFMYGEDIELSFQIKQSGHKLIYLPDTQIIHFKGESTKKLTSRYLKSFYGSMSIYAQKRNASGSFLWSWILNLGILAAGVTAVMKKLFASALRPLLDFILLFVVAHLIQKLWATYYYEQPQYYDLSSFNKIYVVLVSVILFSYYLFGQYDHRHNVKHLIYGFVASGFLTLSIYSLLPLEFRFSRIILLLTLLLSPVVLYLSRSIYNYLSAKTFSFNIDDGKRVAIVGDKNSYARIAEIVHKFSGPGSLVGRIDPSNKGAELGSLKSVKDITSSRKINELIFCSSDLSTAEIFKSMSAAGNQVSFKVANNDNTTILGSASKERVGEWYTLDLSFKISEPFHRRTKRILDVLFCIVAVLAFPLVLLLSSNRGVIFSGLVKVLLGKNTWIGYHRGDERIFELPKIAKAVMTHGNNIGESKEDLHKENLWYARNYSTWLELATLIQKFFR